MKVVTMSKPVASRFFEKGRFQPARLATYLLEMFPCKNANGQFYVYRNGVYEKDGEAFLRSQAQLALGERSRKSYVEEMMYYLQNETYTTLEQLVEPDDEWINCRNGLLNWRTGRLKRHTPERFSTIQIPVSWKPQVKSQHLTDFLSSIVSEDTLPLLLEMIGDCLLRKAQYQKCFIFVGSGSNGKSKLIELIESFVGTRNRSSVSLHELEYSRFKVSQLHNKLVNVCADISHKGLSKTDTIKKIVSGDAINAEFKGQDPFDFNSFATLIFSANTLPATQDLSEGFFRRLMIIPFPNTFTADNRDANLLAKITTEEALSHLFTLAVEGLRRLDSQQGFSENDYTKKALAEYKREADHVQTFIDEECVIGNDEVVPTRRLYLEYKRWSHDCGLIPKGKKNFNKRLMELYPTIVNDYRLERGGVRHWKGIGSRSYKDCD